MSEGHKQIDNTKSFDAKITKLGIRLALLSLLIFWPFVIIRPFIGIIVWSIVLAVALYPAFNRWRNGLADAED